MRHILRDRLKSGMFVALLAYALLLQGLITAYAHGAMAVTVTEAGFVICSPLGLPSDAGPTDEMPPLTMLADGCCTSACRAACGAGTCLPGGEISFIIAPLSGHAPLAGAAPIRQQHLSALLADARGPPPLSV